MMMNEQATSQGDGFAVYTADENVVQTDRATDKKCPQCGGVMDFDPKLGQLHCPYCDYTQDIGQGPEFAEELDFLSAEQTGNHDWGVATKTVLCKSCGASLIYDVMQTAAECAYCGSNQVMEAGVENTLSPGGVLPFVLDQGAASGRFQKWLKGKLFCPKAAKEQAKADQFKGVYLPYWTFDAQTETDYTARYGIVKTRRHKDRTETYTVWHPTGGHYSRFINDQLVIATDRHDPSILRQINPFATDKALAYRPEYIAGFLSERYTKGLKDGWETAKGSIAYTLENEISNSIRSEYRADKVDSYRANTGYRNVTYKYLLLPIWISSFRYRDKVYHFMVNGQTGKVGGKAPISPWRVLIAILIAAALLLGLYALFSGGDVSMNGGYSFYDNYDSYGYYNDYPFDFDYGP